MTKQEFLDQYDSYKKSEESLVDMRLKLSFDYCNRFRKYYDGDVVSIGDIRMFNIVGIHGYDDVTDNIVYNTMLVSNSGEVTRRGKMIGEGSITAKY